MYLKEDIYSTVKKGWLYGSRGEKVRLVSEMGEVLIVEGKTGRFPVRREMVL